MLCYVLSQYPFGKGKETSSKLIFEDGTDPPPLPPDDFIRGNIVNLTHHIKLPSLTEYCALSPGSDTLGKLGSWVTGG